MTDCVISQDGETLDCGVTHQLCECATTARLSVPSTPAPCFQPHQSATVVQSRTRQEPSEEFHGQRKWGLTEDTIRRQHPAEVTER